MLFAKSTVHCMPLAKYLHILLVDDLLYVRTLSFISMFTVLMYVVLLIICLFAYLLSILIVLGLSLKSFI